MIPLHLCSSEKVPKNLKSYLGDSVDEKIWPLVKILNLKGFPTVGSCEGHYLTSWATFIHPWANIDFWQSYQQIDQLQETLKTYNSQNKILWEVTDHNCFPSSYTLEPKDYAPIDELQATILPLAKHLEEFLF